MSHSAGWLKTVDMIVLLYGCMYHIIFYPHTVLGFLKNMRNLERLSSEILVGDHSEKAHNS